MLLTRAPGQIDRRNPYTVSLRTGAGVHQITDLRYWHDWLSAHEMLVAAFNSPVTPPHLIDSLLQRKIFYLQTPLHFAPPICTFSDRAVNVGYIRGLWKYLRPATDSNPYFRFYFDTYHLVVEKCQDNGSYVEVQRYLLHTLRLELLAVNNRRSESPVKKLLVVNVARRAR